MPPSWNEAFLSPDDDGIVRVPILVKGRLRFPPDVRIDQLRAAAGSTDREAESFPIEGAQVIRLPVYDRKTFRPTGEHEYLVFASPDPRELVEVDIGKLNRGLFALKVSEVLGYVGELRRILTEAYPALRGAARRTAASMPLDERLLKLAFDHMPSILDPDALGEAIDRELGSSGYPGRRYLDGWVDVETEARRGANALLADGVFGRTRGGSSRHRPRVKAIPTRQLHVTAGNAPLLPLISFLRGVATKGALVVKSPAEATAVSAILSAAIEALDPDHPISRHTSLVYWKGGDLSFENVLFAPDAFDRVVVWGSPETVRSVRARATDAKTVFLNPRYGMSLIGAGAFPDRVSEAASLAGADSMIANQQACTSSLVHYVEASEEEALLYCRTLQEALARWGEYVPHALPPAALGKLRMLRRGAFLKGTWFTNGTPPAIDSAVIYMRDGFDLAAHPASRCIVVRRVNRIEEALQFLNSAVSTVGVYPTELIEGVRDEAAARGVSNIFPLGEVELAYAGMPHDGMRILSELVNWANA
jgi:Acyl-CoA reductase (LuxC)